MGRGLPPDIHGVEPEFQHIPGAVETINFNTGETVTNWNYSPA